MLTPVLIQLSNFRATASAQQGYKKDDENEIAVVIHLQPSMKCNILEVNAGTQHHSLCWTASSFRGIKFLDWRRMLNGNGRYK